MIKSADLVERFRFALENKWGYIWGTAGILWTEARQKQKVDYMVSKYGASWKKNSDAKNDHYYNAAVYGSKWVGHNVSDCSGMFVWAYRQFGLGMSHISSNIYKSYCSNKGKLTADLKKTIRSGTAVFTGKKAGDHPHVGLYVGNGKVIEASGTQAGVCMSNITDGKWTFYGELTAVEYSDEPAAKPMLKKGDKGSYVKLAQTYLLAKGYDLGKWGVDGDFGSATQAAVKAFQKDNGIKADGIIGSSTWEKLCNDAPVKKYTVAVYHLSAADADALVAKYPGAVKKEEVG